MIRWRDVNGIYQIYPRSFKDSNGDGVGDIAGMTQQLDYIKGGDISLGIDAVWVSPFYRSPMTDFGYDVADYYAVDPLFGDLEDFKIFLREAHERHIRVMVDFVPNHTSDQHPWFIASRSSITNEKRDWYVWRDPKPDGSPPNNWLSVFGGSAWQLDASSGQYYLHSFLNTQPDLNWDNPMVREAMMDVLRFWLDLGVDGIRADAVRWISKDGQLRDNPLNPDFKEGDDPYRAQIKTYSRYGDKLGHYLRQMTEVVASYPDRIILFEDYLDSKLDPEVQYKNMYSVDPEVAAPFNFEGLRLPYSVKEFRGFINRFQKFLGNERRAFYCFGNHDKPRLATRVGHEQARLVGMLQLTLPGIPVIYYGDELGMENGYISAEAVQDPFEKQTPGLGLGRDPVRTPMQWSDVLNAGFTTGEPWLPVADNYRTINVETETQSSSSSLHMYRALLHLRRSSALNSGSYEEWAGSNDAVFGYVRTTPTEELLILLNMSDEHERCTQDIGGDVLYSTHDAVLSDRVSITLAPHQGVIIRRSRR